MSVNVKCILLIYFFKFAISSEIPVESVCKEDQFMCHADKACHSIKSFCDGRTHCMDGSDELYCRGYHCVGSNWFLCKDKQCISSDLACNREYDCIDLTDERGNCPYRSTKETSCPPDQMLCRDEGICIPSTWICNGINECLDGEDENKCNTSQCMSGHKCKSGECLDSEDWICDGVIDCRDGSDEENCENKTIPQFCNADKGLVLCADGKQCIRNQEVCNGVIDCLDLSDEVLCQQNCTLQKCPESRKCITTTSKTYTGNWCTCPPGFRLENGKDCVDMDECSLYGMCDQLCTNTIGSYNCSCIQDYFLGPDNKTCLVNESSPSIHFTDTFSVKGLLTKAEMTFLYVKDLNYAVGISFSGTHLYFTDKNDDGFFIIRANDIGQNRHIFLSIGLKIPEILAVDHTTKNLYFTDGGSKSIGVCTVIGNFCKTIKILQNDKARGLALHSLEGKMYWSEWGDTPRIARANMDGSNETSFLTSNIFKPNGIAIDTHAYTQRLYWADSQKRVIESVTVGGEDRRIIYKANLNYPNAVTVFENRVYWADRTARTIESCYKLNGDNYTFHAKYSRATVSGLEAYHAVLHEQLINPCKDSLCEELCLLTSANNYTCACTEGKVAATDFSCGYEIGPQKLLLGTKRKLFILEPKLLGRFEITPLPIVSSKITAVAYQITDNTVLLVDDNTKSIIKIELSKNYTMEVILTDNTLGLIQCLAYDYFGNNLYWCDSKKRNIEFYNMNTADRKVIATFIPGLKPVSLTLIPEVGYIVYALHNSIDSKSEIYIMDMSGSSKKLISSNMTGPVHLTYDPYLETIFAGDFRSGTIKIFTVKTERCLISKQHSSFDYSTSCIKLINNTYYTAPESSITGIATLKDNVFWLQHSTSKLYWADKILKNEERTTQRISLEDDIGSHADITQLISISYPKPANYHPCSNNNGNCSHICTPGIMMSAKCSCPLGMQLSTDKKTCFTKVHCTNKDFLCNITNICIPRNMRCDHHKDCVNGEDEDGCKLTVYCPEDYFQCSNGDCIDKLLRCDYNYDCSDNSDEEHCDLHHGGCARDQFMCDNKTCIPTDKVCNNALDCDDGEDEKDCNCPLGTFRCKTSKHCIPKNWFCDNHQDCKDNSDEPFECDASNCRRPNFQCNNGPCISAALECDGKDDCGDNSDEEICKQNNVSQTSEKCGPKYFLCGETDVCVPEDAICNNVRECPGGEDEEDCQYKCLLSGFMCKNESKCISEMFVCDNYPDCIDESDESHQLCSKYRNTKEYPIINTCDNKFPCSDGHCIDYNLVCDGNYNCGDRSDEEGQCSVTCKNTTCSQLCQRRPTGPTCLCTKGFQLGADNKTCEDIQECSIEPPVCSQLCIETNGSHKCDCFKDFKLDGYDGASCKILTGKNNIPSIMLASESMILRVTEKLQTQMLIQINFTSGFEVFTSQNMYYYSYASESKIFSYNFTEIVEYIVHGHPKQLSLDWVSGNMYYISDGATNRSIIVCDMKSLYCFNIRTVYSPNRIPVLKVDAKNKLIFYIVLHQNDFTVSTIYKSSLDGSNVKIIYKSETKNDETLTKLGFDFRKKLLYVYDKKKEYIFQINYDGENKKDILRNVIVYKGLSIFEDHLFFFSTKNTIERCPLFVNYNACVNHTLRIKQVNDFTVNHTTTQPALYNICKNSTCKHLCIPFEEDYRCLCEDNDHLDACTKHASVKITRIIESRTPYDILLLYIGCIIIIFILAVGLVATKHNRIREL